MSDLNHTILAKSPKSSKNNLTYQLAREEPRPRFCF